MAFDQSVPVITIDGPTASGKGTIAHRVAEHLGWHVLDSGALYRLTALVCFKQQIPTDDESQIAQLARDLPVKFIDQAIYLEGHEVSDDIRQEYIGVLASKIASMPTVREALLQRQLDFRTAPGLVADGRDMGTVVFKDAALKVFLQASAEARAQRRHLQLMKRGISAKLEDLLRDLQERDTRDKQRTVAPLVPAFDAHILDSSDLSIDQTVSCVLNWYNDLQKRDLEKRDFQKR